MNLSLLSSPTVVWAVVLIFCVILEIMTAALVSIWFVFGATAALIVSLLTGSLVIQLVTFAIVSLVTLITIKPLANRALRGNIVPTNIDRIIGQHALVTKTIDADNYGEVKLRGHYWRAVSRDNDIINVDEYVEILAIEGNHLIVTK